MPLDIVQIPIVPVTRHYGTVSCNKNIIICQSTYAVILIPGIEDHGPTKLRMQLHLRDPLMFLQPVNFIKICSPRKQYKAHQRFWNYD